MCEASAYFLRGEDEELIFKEVAKLVPLGDDKYELVTFMGDKKVVEGKLKEINLLRHKIILIPTE